MLLWYSKYTHFYISFILLVLQWIHVLLDMYLTTRLLGRSLGACQTLKWFINFIILFLFSNSSWASLLLKHFFHTHYMLRCISFIYKSKLIFFWKKSVKIMYILHFFPWIVVVIVSFHEFSGLELREVSITIAWTINLLYYV